MVTARDGPGRGHCGGATAKRTALWQVRSRCGLRFRRLPVQVPVPASSVRACVFLQESSSEGRRGVGSCSEPRMRTGAIERVSGASLRRGISLGRGVRARSSAFDTVRIDCRRATWSNDAVTQRIRNTADAYAPSVEDTTWRGARRPVQPVGRCTRCRVATSRDRTERHDGHWSSWGRDDDGGPWANARRCACELALPPPSPRQFTRAERCPYLVRKSQAIPVTPDRMLRALTVGIAPSSWGGGRTSSGG